MPRKAKKVEKVEKAPENKPEKEVKGKFKVIDKNGKVFRVVSKKEEAIELAKNIDGRVE